MPPEPHGRSGSRPPGRRERRTGEPTGAWVDSAAASTTIGTPLTAIKGEGLQIHGRRQAVVSPPAAAADPGRRRGGWGCGRKGARPALGRGLTGPGGSCGA